MSATECIKCSVVLLFKLIFLRKSDQHTGNQYCKGLKMLQCTCSKLYKDSQMHQVNELHIHYQFG